MATKRNLLMTLGVTALLIAGLFVLFPSSAVAAEVTNVSVGNMANPDGQDHGSSNGQGNGDEAFTITAQVLIPAGEHIPLNYARVIVAQAESPINTGPSNELAGTVYCDLVGEVVSVTGAPRAISAYTGYGYDIDGSGDYGYGYDYGYGFAQSGKSEVFNGYASGTGYGYGYAHGDSIATVTVKVTGCHEELWNNVPNYKASPFYETFRIQVIVGGDATHAIHSYPATAILSNPFATGGGSIVGDLSGFTVVGGSIGAGSTHTITLPGGIIAEVKVTTKAPLSASTKLQIDKVPNPGSTSPAFGVPSLGTQFPGKGAALQFQFRITDGNGNPVDLNGKISLTIKLDIPKSYFGPAAGETKNDFRIFAYDASGNLKPAGQHPVVQLPPADNGDKWRYTVHVDHFSSYAAGASIVSAPAGSGGGAGGGGGGGNFTKTQTVTPITQTTTTVTPTETVTETATSSGKKETPGIELGILAVALAGAAIVIRRRL